MYTRLPAALYILYYCVAPSIISFNPIQEEMVGNLLTIECRVDTVAGVNSLMINWTGPGGVAISNSTRMTIGPTTRSGNTYTSSLQFTYLMEGDEGNYTCNVMILDTTGSQSIELLPLNSKLPLTYLHYVRMHYVNKLDLMRWPKM